MFQPGGGGGSASPLTTKGDLYTYSTLDTRLAVGATNGFVLAVASGQATGLEWIAGPGLQNVRSVTGTDTALTTDGTIVLSNSSFTFTLYTAVGNAGRVLTLVHNGTSLTQLYTLATTGGQTIGGVASGSYILATTGERLQIVSDGTNWQVLDHDAETGWVSDGVITIGATTTPPTKATGIIVDRLLWRREGKDAILRWEYAQNNTTSAAIGTGDYLFRIPANMTMDTATITVFTTVIGGGAAYVATNCVGSGQSAGSGTNAQLTVIVYDTTQVRFGFGNTTSGGIVSATGYPLNGTGTAFTAIVRVPISGWQP